jgi:hypothetical protein
MSFNGSGTFLINTAGQPVVAGTVISSTAFNALTADLATGLSTVITKDGQTTVTANIPMSTYKFTGLGVGSAATDSANLSQVQSTVTKLLTSVSGADTITAVGAPVVAAYAAGQMFYFVATGDNTGAVTLNIDSLGAKAVTRDGSVALAAGDIKSGEVVVVVYDGTRFQVVSQLNSAGNATFANVSITSALNVGGVATFSAGTAAAPSITTTGDTNTGIFFPAADTIAFTEGGVEAARFDSSGNLGIGTASPGYRLTVSGGATSLAANQYLRFGAGIFASSDGSVDNYLFTGSTALRWRNSADNAELMQLTNTGNLGIGTSSPGSKLHVATLTSETAVQVTNNNATVYLGAVYASNNFANGTVAGQGIVRSGAGIAFSANGGTSVQALLDSSGNLGLGVTPSAWSSYKPYQVGWGALASTAATQNTLLSSNVFFDGANFKYIGTGTASYLQQFDGSFIWKTAPSGTAGNTISFTQAMTLDASGNLGVGVTSPSGKIACQVTASGTFQNAIVASDGTSSDFLVKIKTNETQIMNSGSSVLSFGTSNTERARITSGGDLLVGTTSQLYGERFNVTRGGAGTNCSTLYFNTSDDRAAEIIRHARASGATQAPMIAFLDSGGTERGTIKTDGSATAYNTSSDRRLKENIASADEASSVIDAIKIVKHNWKSGGHVRFGVIAQDLHQVAPEAVSAGDDGEEIEKTWGVDYSKLVPMLVKEIQSLRVRVAQLETK